MRKLNEWGRSAEPTDDEVAWGYKNDEAKKMGYSGANDPEYQKMDKDRADARLKDIEDKRTKERETALATAEKNRKTSLDNLNSANPKDVADVREFLTRGWWNRYVGSRSVPGDFYRLRAANSMLDKSERLIRQIANRSEADRERFSSPSDKFFTDEHLMDIMVDLIISEPNPLDKQTEESNMKEGVTIRDKRTEHIGPNETMTQSVEELDDGSMRVVLDYGDGDVYYYCPEDDEIDGVAVSCKFLNFKGVGKFVCDKYKKRLDGDESGSYCCDECIKAFENGGDDSTEDFPVDESMKPKMKMISEASEFVDYLV